MNKLLIKSYTQMLSNGISNNSAVIRFRMVKKQIKQLPLSNVMSSTLIIKCRKVKISFWGTINF